MKLFIFDNQIENLKTYGSKIFVAVGALFFLIVATIYYKQSIYERYQEMKKEEIRRINIIIGEEDRKRVQRKIYSESFNHGMFLAFDLDGDGIESYSIASSKIFFDLDGDGFKEKVGWIKGDDGILFMDSNGNNVVDNIGELFGYRKENGEQVTGIDELKTYDANKDGLIDAEDAIYSKLMMWQDFNQDGQSQIRELRSLAEHKIKYIDLSSEVIAAARGANKGNSIASVSTYAVLEEDYDYQIANLKLRINQADSMFGLKDYNINYDVIYLPFSRGYGNVEAWHIAMSKDIKLLEKMKNMVNLEHGVNYQNLDSKIEDFIYQWTATQSVKGVRGVFDARKLAAMEKIEGKPFIDELGNDKVSYYNLENVKTSWHDIIIAVKAKILIQGILKDIFSKATYDFEFDEIKFNKMNIDYLLTEVVKKYNALDDDEQISFIRHVVSISDIFVGKVSGIESAKEFKDALSKKIGFVVE